MDKALKTTQCFDYMAYAIERLNKAGFVLKYTSMKSEACYYEHPSRKGRLIRIAAHRYKRHESVHFPYDLGIVAAAITFSPTAPMEKSWEKVDWKIYHEVGRYFLDDIKARLKKYIPKQINHEVDE